MNGSETILLQHLRIHHPALHARIRTTPTLRSDPMRARSAYSASRARMRSAVCATRRECVGIFHPGQPRCDGFEADPTDLQIPVPSSDPRTQTFVERARVQRRIPGRPLLHGDGGIGRPAMTGDPSVFVGCSFAELDGDKFVAFVCRAEFKSEVVEQFSFMHGDDDLSVVLL